MSSLYDSSITLLYPVTVLELSTDFGRDHSKSVQSSILYITMGSSLDSVGERGENF